MDRLYYFISLQFISVSIIVLLIICSFLLHLAKLYNKTNKVKTQTDVVAQFSQTLIHNIDYLSKSSYIKELKV